MTMSCQLTRFMERSFSLTVNPLSLCTGCIWIRISQSLRRWFISTVIQLWCTSTLSLKSCDDSSLWRIWQTHSRFVLENEILIVLSQLYALLFDLGLHNCSQGEDWKINLVVLISRLPQQKKKEKELSQKLAFSVKNKTKTQHSSAAVSVNLILTFILQSGQYLDILSL